MPRFQPQSIVHSFHFSIKESHSETNPHIKKKNTITIKNIQKSSIGLLRLHPLLYLLTDKDSDKKRGVTVKKVSRLMKIWKWFIENLFSGRKTNQSIPARPHLPAIWVRHRTFLKIPSPTRPLAEWLLICGIIIRFLSQCLLLSKGTGYIDLATLLLRLSVHGIILRRSR